ncbi:MAG: C25 family cysteine peptidase [Candidatus Cloacimonas sp.]
MKKILCLLLLCLPLIIMATTLNTTVQFPVLENGLSTSSLSKQGYGFSGAPGTLQLPVKQINILLPKDAVVDNWQITFPEAKTLPGESPAVNPAFTDGEHILTYPFQRNIISRYRYQGLRKWGELNFACFSVLPAVYNGSNWLWNSSCQILINYTASAKTKGTIPPTCKNANYFANPQYLTQWYNTSKERNNHLLIITTPELYNALSALVFFRQSQNIDVSFCNIATALASGMGTDNAEKLRNFLQNTYNQNPFSYLLLAGDYDIIPPAYVTPEPDGAETVPTDFFYSDLSSDWDTDNDGRRGEYSTGYMDEDYGIDFTPEVFVGRISTNVVSEVSSIANRIVEYEQVSEPWKDKNLLPACFLNYQDEPELGFLPTDGGLFMDYLCDTCLAEQNNFTMYEQEGVVTSFPSDLPVNYDNLRNKINAESWGFINWSAHGSATSSSRKVWMADFNHNNIPDGGEMDWMGMVDRQSFISLQNQDGTVIFAASCDNGMLDINETCLAEYALIKKAVGVLAATRTGWYKIGWLNPGWGGLSSYNYHFVENFRQNKLDLGSAHSYANLLHTQYYLFGDSLDTGGIIYPELQNVYTFMLFGDPMIGWTDEEPNLNGEILVWEPSGNEGIALVNAIHQLTNFNVIYTDKLIPDYNYINNFEAVFYLAGDSILASSLEPTSFAYSYLNSYLEAGGKLYCENYIDASNGPLYTKMGAQLADPVNISSLYHPETHFSWNYAASDSLIFALLPNQETASGIFLANNGETDNPILAILNSTDDYKVITSSFQFSQVQEGEHTLAELAGIILSALDVYDYIPDGNSDPVFCPAIQTLSVYPNPAIQNSQISFNLNKSASLSLSVYNIKGQKVKDLVNAPMKNGSHQFSWNGKDNYNRKCSSGVYYYKISVEGKSFTKKLLLLN